MTLKVAIIGGGACGLLLANLLEQHHISYELFEKSLLGRKLLASGNGKANLGNMYIDASVYNSTLGYTIVDTYRNKLAEVWKQFGLLTKSDEEGRIYPYSESSLSVLQILTKKKLNVIENFSVQSITKINAKYYLNEVRGPFDYVVLAIGSIASFTSKKQLGFYQLLQDLNIKMTSLNPSLVGFKLQWDCKRLFGLRVKCRVFLLQEEKLVYQEFGEVIFKNDGISGICVMNLSSYYSRLKSKQNCRIRLDLFPDQEIKVSSYEDLIGLVHPKLVEYFKSFSIKELNCLLHNFTFPILGVYDFEFAQVVAGGISLEEIDEHLRLKKDSHIYAGGEILDVDGICGGYNLMFAFCCALKIGEELCNIK